MGVFFRNHFFNDVGGGRVNPWSNQLLLQPADRDFLSEIYPYSLLPASFLIIPCMLVSQPSTLETAAWSGEPVSTPIVSVNDFLRPLLPKYFPSKCTAIPAFPALNVDGTLRRAPAQVVSRLDFSFTVWGLIYAYDPRNQSVTVHRLRSVGGTGGRFTGSHLQQNGENVSEEWKLSEVISIVNAKSHGRSIYWNVE